MESLRDYFRPEFLNRVDDIILFDILSKEAIEKIVTIQIGVVADRLLGKEHQSLRRSRGLLIPGKRGLQSPVRRAPPQASDTEQDTDPGRQSHDFPRPDQGRHGLVRHEGWRDRHHLLKKEARGEPDHHQSGGAGAVKKTRPVKRGLWSRLANRHLICWRVA